MSGDIAAFADAHLQYLRALKAKSKLIAAGPIVDWTWALLLIKADSLKEARELAEAYLRAGVLGKTCVSDALHVAAASVAGADLILSWNFKHIVNFSRIKGFNGVNVMNGYPLMTILCPLEVCDDD